MPPTLIACLGPSHTFIVLVIGVLLFGRRLPEIGRSVGKHILEFRKGLVSIEDDIWSGMVSPSVPQPMQHFAEESSNDSAMIASQPTDS